VDINICDFKQLTSNMSDLKLVINKVKNPYGKSTMSPKKMAVSFASNVYEPWVMGGIPTAGRTTWIIP